MVREKARETPDLVARIVGLISGLVAIAGVVISVLAMAEQRHQSAVQQSQFAILQSEQLGIHLDPHVDGPLRMTQGNFGPMGMLVQIPWRLVLTNTGFQRLSVTSYSMLCETTRGELSYSGIDGGVCDEKQHPVQLPLAIDPGDTVQLFVFVGMLVPARVYTTLAALEPALQTVNQARQVLAQQGCDLYGNPVEYREYPGGEYIGASKEDQQAPTFWFRVVTGRGNVFQSSASVYSAPNWLATAGPPGPQRAGGVACRAWVLHPADNRQPLTDRHPSPLIGPRVHPSALECFSCARSDPPTRTEPRFAMKTWPVPARARDPRRTST